MYFYLLTLHLILIKSRVNIQLVNFFIFLFAYATSPATVMKLVVFFRSSKRLYNFW